MTMLPGAASAQDQIPVSITPPSWIQVCDRPNDNGNAIIITWEPSAQDQGLTGPITGYEILRSPNQRGPFETVGRVRSGSRRYVDIDAGSGVPYYYKVLAVTGSESITSELAGPVHATHQWFNRSRLNLLLIGLLMTGIMVFYIFSVRPGTEPALRRLPGIEALEEAIEQAATEDRPVLFVTGSEDLN
ncbi:MAG: fibronectin type III domain-containing protein, partial [bacterium]